MKNRKLCLRNNSSLPLMLIVKQFLEVFRKRRSYQRKEV